MSGSTVLARQPSRALRATAFAGASAGLAVAAHRLAGGQVPGATTIALATASLLLLGGILSARQRSGRQITALVLLTQTVLHVSFMLSTGMWSGPSSAVTGGGSATPSTSMLARMLFCFTGNVQPTDAQITAAMSRIGTSHLTLGAGGAAGHMATMGMNDNPLTAGGLAMISAHLLAALVMAWWLRRGERAAWAALERAVAALRWPSVAGLAPAGPASLQVFAGLWLPMQQVWGSGLAGRGPPASARLTTLIA
jgi:hypothetical protein